MYGASNPKLLGDAETTYMVTNRKRSGGRLPAERRTGEEGEQLDVIVIDVPAATDIYKTRPRSTISRRRASSSTPSRSPSVPRHDTPNGADRPRQPQWRDAGARQRHLLHSGIQRLAAAGYKGTITLPVPAE